jgi:hypothetical protein
VVGNNLENFCQMKVYLNQDIKMNKEEAIKQLAEKYEQIENLVDEYNVMSNKHKLDTRVGCIINCNNDDEDDEDSYSDDTGYDYRGWMPSSLGC